MDLIKGDTKKIIWMAIIHLRFIFAHFVYFLTAYNVIKNILNKIIRHCKCVFLNKNISYYRKMSKLKEIKGYQLFAKKNYQMSRWQILSRKCKRMLSYIKDILFRIGDAEENVVSCHACHMSHNYFIVFTKKLISWPFYVYVYCNVCRVKSIDKFSKIAS